MKSRRLQTVLALLAACAWLLPVTLHAADIQPSPPGEKTVGYRCVFMGHSFFYPIADDFGKLAAANGFPKHSQVLKKAGGTTGTPGWLWTNMPKNEEVWRTLATEKVDLLGFTWHTKFCNLEDYCNWIDYARKKNPEIMVAIAIPWPNSFDVTPDAYAARYDVIEAAVHRLVDALREKYPENAVFAIPHGKGVVELYAEFKAGELKEVKSLLPPGDETFFRDRGCHAGKMPAVLSRLIFLATIYQTDVRQSKWDTGYQADLKQMAYNIVRNDPYARIVKGKQAPATPNQHTSATGSVLSLDSQ